MMPTIIALQTVERILGCLARRLSSQMMPRGFGKTIHNPCPICGLPRGKGQHEFAHGKCLEQRAKTEGKQPAGKVGKKFERITKEQAERGRANAAAKRYASGNLPSWMFD
jgi:hypothetical protein